MFQISLRVLTYIQTFFSKYATHNRHYKVKSDISKWNLLELKFHFSMIQNSVSITSLKLLDFLKYLLKIGQNQLCYFNRRKLNGANESFLKIIDSVRESQLDCLIVL